MLHIESKVHFLVNPVLVFHFFSEFSSGFLCVCCHALQRLKEWPDRPADILGRKYASADTDNASDFSWLWPYVPCFIY